MTEAEPLQITAYVMKEQPGALEFPIITAFPRREWMNFRDNNPYHCLPLTIANQMGWFMLNPVGFVAEWQGEEVSSPIKIEYDEPLANDQLFMCDHFGNGVMTWGLPYLFRTSPGYNLLARGPANWPKDGIQALEGIIETDWAEAPFTMNWKFTRAHHPVRFEKGEPFCMIVPVQRGEYERFEAGVEPLSANPEMQEAYLQWRQKREELRNANLLQQRLAQAFKQPMNMQYMHNYIRGRISSGEESIPEHQTSIHMKPFKESWQKKFYKILNSAKQHTFKFSDEGTSS